MLWWLFVIAAILFIIWIAGLGTGFLGNLIWIFLVVAVIVFLVSLLTGRRRTF